MGIQELEIKGFKSLRHVRWTPGRLNVLIGPNGSGKSNLLDACALLQEAVQGKLANGIVSRGGMAPLLWDGRENSITWDVRIRDREQTSFHYHLDLQQLGNTSNFKVEFERLSDGQIDHLQRSPTTTILFDPKQGHAVKSDPAPESETLASLLSSPFGLPAVQSFQSDLASWGIFQSFRTDQQSQIRQAVVTRFEKRFAADGQNMVSALHTLYTGDRSFKEDVDSAMRAAFGTEYEEIVFPPAADQRIQLRLRWRSLEAETSAASLSDGTLRFLFIIAVLANPEPDALIAIDEPETGLHPKMFPIIAEFAVEAARKKQVIFTTHSSQFLDAFREEPPTTTVTESVNGETRLTVLDGDRLGEWLKHYSLGDLYETGELEGMA